MIKNEKPVYIIGAGAIGKALAVFLSSVGKEVVLLRGQHADEPDQIAHLEVELDNEELIKGDVRVSCVERYPSLEGTIVIAAKSFANQSIAEKLKNRQGRSPIVLLQNGLNVEQPFMEAGFPEIYRCVLFATSQPVDTNRLRYRPASFSPIGLICGTKHGLTSVVESLCNLHMLFRVEENIQPVIWTKTIINCVFNSVCPLLETDNGIFHRNEKALTIAGDIIDECVGIAHAHDIVLSVDHVKEKLLQISRASDGQLISTYQDILGKRKTEIDTFNMAIAGIAERMQRRHLVQKTALLGELIALKAELSMA